VSKFVATNVTSAVVPLTKDINFSVDQMQLKIIASELASRKELDCVLTPLAASNVT
jgi:hypothetical protein